jgi:hypothetical protein
MQEEIEITRIAKNVDTGEIAVTKKMVNLSDIVSIEEASSDVQSLLERSDICCMTLTYEDLCVVGSYKKYKKLFLEYGAYVKSKEGINFLKN